MAAASVGGAPPGGAPVDLAAHYAGARRLVAGVEYQLQQLEEGRRPAAPTATGVGTGGPDDARQSLSSDVNRLFAEVAQLERGVEEQYGGGAAAGSQKALLWRKCVLCVV